MSKPSPTIGIDFTSGTLRFATLQQRKRGIEILHLMEKPLPDGTMHDGAVTNPEALTKVIRSALLSGGHNHAPQRAGVALPDSQTFVFTVDVAHTDGNEAEAVRWEAAQQLPFDVSEVFLDWTLLGEYAGMRQYQVAAAPRTLVEQYLGVIDALQITTTLMMPSALGAVHALTLTDAQLPAIVLSLDHVITSLALIDTQSIPLTATTSDFGQDNLIATLIEKLKLTKREAEKAKRIYGFDTTADRGAIAKALHVPFKALLRDIEQMRAFAHTGRMGHAVRSLVLMGSGSTLKGLDVALHESTKLDIIVHPFRSDLMYAQRDEQGAKRTDAPNFVSAIGLGILTL